MSNFIAQIKNYQRIRSGKVEFVPGLNVITGESNQGKSTLTRAIQTAVFNISKDSHITFGETKSAVGIKYNGHEVIWRRDSTEASPVTYRVDGKILSKLGRGQPKVIADCLGMKEVELEDSKIRINFLKQMTYPFLLDKTPSQLFKFIVQSAEEDNIMEVLSIMKTDLGQMSVNVAATEKSRDDLGVQLKKSIDRYNEKKSALPTCERVLAMEGKVKNYGKLGDLLESIVCLEAQRNEFNAKIADNNLILNELTKLSDRLNDKIARAVSLSTLCGSIVLLESDMKYTKEKLSAVVESLENYESIDDIKDKVQVIITKGNRSSEINNRIRSFNDLVNVREDHKSKVSIITSTVQDLDRGIEKLSLILDSLSKKVQLRSNLNSMYLLLRDNYSLLSQCTKLKLSNESETELVEKELIEFGVCPYCGNQIGEADEHN